MPKALNLDISKNSRAKLSSLRIKAQAKELRKKVFAQATPEGASLYSRLRFELHKEAIVELNRFGGRDICLKHHELEST